MEKSPCCIDFEMDPRAGAVLAVGANATYGVWITRAARPRKTYLSRCGEQWIDDRMANPAYALSWSRAADGVGRPAEPGHSLAAHQPGVICALVLLGLLGLYAHVAAADPGPGKPGSGCARYQALARRGIWLGIILAVLAMASCS